MADCPELLDITRILMTSFDVHSKYASKNVQEAFNLLHGDCSCNDITHKKFVPENIEWYYCKRYPNIRQNCVSLVEHTSLLYTHNQTRKPACIRFLPYVSLLQLVEANCCLLSAHSPFTLSTRTKYCPSVAVLMHICPKQLSAVITRSNLSQYYIPRCDVSNRM